MVDGKTKPRENIFSRFLFPVPFNLILRYAYHCILCISGSMSMEHVLNSEEFLNWFCNLKHIVNTNGLTEDELDPNDFVEHFLDDYSESSSIAEYFDFQV